MEERNGSWASPYLFNAKELDEETGLYYYGARYLNPSIALWLSTDPLQGKHPGMSPYNYCAGNPVKLVDPDGRDYDANDEETVKHKRLIVKELVITERILKQNISNLNKKEELTKDEKRRLEDYNDRYKDITDCITKFKEIEKDKTHTFRIRTTNSSIADFNPTAEDIQNKIYTLVYLDGDIGNAFHEAVIHAWQLYKGLIDFTIVDNRYVMSFSKGVDIFSIEKRAYQAQYSYKGVLEMYESPSPDCEDCHVGSKTKQTNELFQFSSYKQITRTKIRMMRKGDTGDVPLYTK